MVAKKGKRSSKKVGTLKAKSMSAAKARGVRGGSLSINQVAAHEKWIEFSPRLPYGKV